ncbi:MAG: hypothetical protein AB8B50_18240 [Pirellulaceae bacterium]
MNEKKPTPLSPASKAKRCPVCKEPTYSAAGIHPQCAVKQADEPRRLELVAERKAQSENKKTDSTSNDADPS